MTATITAYTTYGEERGCCGHRHKSLAAAQKCLDRDRGGCSSQGDCSDRSVVLIGQDGHLYHDGCQVTTEDGDHWVKSDGGRGIKFVARLIATL